MKKIFSFLLIAVMALSLIGLSGCNSSLPKVEFPTLSEESEPPISFDESTQLQISDINAVDEATKEKITRECLKIAESYKSLYLDSVKEPSLYSEEYMLISREDYDKIVAFLASQGIAIAKPNGDETDTLLNPQGFAVFWQQVEAGKDTSFTIYTLSENGTLCYSYYDFNKGEKRRLNAYLEWDANNNPQVTNISSTPLSFWDYTPKGNFIFKATHCPKWDANAHGLIHIDPYDEKLLEYGQKYIKSFGYNGSNLFLTDWNESDFGNLNFNDLFEYLYRHKNGDYFRGDQYDYVQETFSRYLPEGVFEPIIMSYFKISQENLRSRTLYDASYGGYPWQNPIASLNPFMIPDVQNYTDNGDGTATMCIEVLATEEKTDCLFTHEVTVRNLPNGGFQYVSNKIISSDEETFPRYNPRIAEQRPSE